MMLASVAKPSKQQVLLFRAVNRELKKKTRGYLDDETRYIIVSSFVSNFDFSNSALAHKSASGWADMIVSQLSHS